MPKRRKLALFKGDSALWIIIAVLCVASLLVVYSSTVSMAYRDAGGDTTRYLIRQAWFMILGFAVIIVVHRIPYRWYSRFSKPLFWFSVILVLLALFVGETRNEASRWLPIPVFGRFQPSEVLKISLMMLLATQLGRRQKIIDRIPILPSFSTSKWRANPQKNIDIFERTTRPLVLPIYIACIVVFPSNLSTALIMFFVSMVVFYVGRVRFKELFRLAAITTAVLVLVIGSMKVMGVGRADVWITRVENFVLPKFGVQMEKTPKQIAEDFQTEQAVIAIASGGPFGKGPGQSTQRSQLPHPYSDFAYAFIIEEYGAVGGVVIFLLYLWIFYRAGVIVRRCQRKGPSLLVLGLSLSITVQAFANMMVSVGLAPVTGQPLPLISLGGSSIIFTCIAFGMILGISRESDHELAQEKVNEMLAQQGVTPLPPSDFSGEEIRIQPESDDSYDQLEIEVDNLEEFDESPFSEEPSFEIDPPQNSQKSITIVDDKQDDDDFEFQIVEHPTADKASAPSRRQAIDLYQDENNT